MNQVIKACYLGFLGDGKVNNWFDAAIEANRLKNKISLAQELRNVHGIQINLPVTAPEAADAASEIIIFYAVDKRTMAQREHDVIYTMTQRHPYG